MPPTPHRTARRRRAARRGFALAEVLIALGMLAAGLLAVAGASLSLLRADTAARSAASASALIAERVERVVAARCGDSSGARTSRGADERWRTFVADDVRTLADTVRYGEPGIGIVAVGVEAPVRCAP